MTFRRGLPVLALSAALIAGCGGDSSKETKTDSQSAAQAQTEIGVVRSGLDDALVKYKSGDSKAADTQVGDLYLEHFELVEGPLEAKDAELNERLEDAIREELRDKIQAKAPAPEIAKLVTRIQSDLDKAEVALR